jgi:uncharacterized membrane protein
MTPIWALTIAYWMHMLATVVWIGGLAILSILVIPAARKSLEGQVFAVLLESIQRRLDPLAWFSMLVLLGSGMLQMSANPNYGGFLTVDNTWAVAILVKHILFGLMVVVSSYITWGILPALRRAALQQARGIEISQIDLLQRREANLLRLNLILGVLVLALTALARSA